MRSLGSWARYVAYRVYEEIKLSAQIDTRTLAVFRMFVAVLIIADVLSRSRNFSFYYTDDGAVPQELAMNHTADNAFSFFFYTSDPTIIAALFVIHALVALQLFVGYKTRIATVVSFLFVISLDHHNPFVTSYADVIFRLLLFWAIFIPLGERWSVDAVHRDRAPRATVVSIATLGILFQMIAMYFINGLHKSENELWTGGDATLLIMGLDDMTFLLGEFTRDFPALLQLGTLSWYYMLLFSWLLFLLRGRLRMAFAGMFFFAHGTFAITVRIGAFPYAAWAGLLMFLQTQFWEDLEAAARWVALPVDRIIAGARRLEAVAYVFPRYVPTRGIEQWITRGVYTGFYGVLALLVVTMVLLAGLQAGGAVGADQGPKAQMDDAASTVNVDQPEWSIFAPVPRTSDRYYVFPALTEDGDRIDVYNDDRELTFDRPGQKLQQQYDAYRERFYMNSVRRAGDSGGASLELARHLCDSWEDENGTGLTHVNMYYVTEDVTEETVDDPDERDQATRVIYRHGCGSNEPQTILPDGVAG